MKTPRQLLFVLGALCGAAGLFGQGSTATPPKTLHHDHDELSFVAEPLVRKFQDKSTGGNVTVTWTYLGQEGTWPNVSDRYQCDIHQDVPSNSTFGYSLYNLQLQGRRWETQVHVLSGSQVVFTGGPAAAITTATWPGTTKVYNKVPMIARGAWNPNAPDSLADDRVGFIKFAGTDCSLEVLSKRHRHSPKLNFQPGFVILTSHDATPPPPEGGGEN